MASEQIFGQYETKKNHHASVTAASEKVSGQNHGDDKFEV